MKPANLSDVQVYEQGQLIIRSEKLDDSSVGGVWLSGFHFAMNHTRLA